MDQQNVKSPETGSTKTVISKPTSKGTQFTEHKAVVVVVVAVLVVISLGIYGAYRYGVNKGRQSAQTTKAAVVYNKDSLIAEVGKLVGKKQYQQAIDLINKQPASLKNSNEIQTVLGTVYVNKGDYKAALKVFDGISGQSGMTAALAANAAAAAAKDKNYTKAIEYYKVAKEKTLADKNNPVASSEASYYDKQIQELQKNVSSTPQ